MRQAIVEEALTWVQTPWHHAECVKGAGVDCVGLLRGVYNAVGLTHIQASEIPYYPPDIMLHKNAETVLDVIVKYAKEVEQPQMGDVVLWRFGHIFAHAGIIINWPMVVHAYKPSRMVLVGSAEQGDLQKRERKFFSMIGVEL